MCECSAYVAFNKATNGQTDIKHEKEKKIKFTVEDLSWKVRSLAKIELRNEVIFCTQTAFAFNSCSSSLETSPMAGVAVGGGHRVDARLCVACNQRAPGTMFLPCSHVVACPGCADVTERCQRCHKTILGTVDLARSQNDHLIPRQAVKGWGIVQNNSNLLGSTTARN